MSERASRAGLDARPSEKHPTLDVDGWVSEFRGARRRNLGATLRRATLTTAWLLTASLLIGLLTPFATRADSLDARQLDQLQQYPLHVRWENLEGAPAWVCGVEPVARRGTRFHWLDLHPGQTSTFRVPPRAMVRVHRTKKRLNLDDVEIWVSDGSGLYRRQLAALSRDGRSLLAAPESPQSCLVRVHRPREHRSGVSVAVFTSRHESHDVSEPFRRELEVVAPRVEVRKDEEQQSTTFYRLTPDRDPVLDVQGPARLLIQSRLVYPPLEARMFQTYRIEAWLGDRLFKRLELETGSESRRRVYVDERLPVLGEQQSSYLDLPPGRHALKLTTTAEIYARVLMQSGAEDYLLPRWNRPLDVGPQSADPWRSIASTWDVDTKSIRELVTAEGVSPATLSQIALRSARDNAHRDGGLQSVMLMRLAASVRPEAGEIRRLADRLQRFHAYYRYLTPLRKPAHARQELGWFSQRRLLNPGESRADIVLARQHADDALRLLSQAAFVQAGDDHESALLYRLPAERPRTLLRVIVDRDSVTGTRPLMLQFDDQAPVNLLVIGAAELADSAYATSRGQAAMGVVEGHVASRSATSMALVSHRGPAGRRIRAAACELVLPARVETIRVWCPQGRPPRVSLQRLTSKPFQLSESEWFAMRGKAEPLPTKHLLKVRKASLVASDPTRELENHWIPLSRLLRSHEVSVAAAVRKPLVTDRGEASQWQVDAPALEAAAQDLVAGGQWLPALERWSEWLQSEQADSAEGLRRRSAALRQLGEHFLADRQLLGHLAFAEDEEQFAVASDELCNHYAEQGEWHAWERVLSVAALRATREEHLSELAHVLMENGRTEFAVQIATLLPEKSQPADVVLRGSLELRWWRTFEQALSVLPQTQQRFWQGLRLLNEGQWDAGLKRLEQGGVPGEQFARHARQGAGIARRLDSRDATRRWRAVLEWEDWQQSHPGPFQWQDADWSVVDYQRGDELYSLDRDIRARFYRATPEQGVRLEVNGPARVKLIVRPVHETNREGPLEGWFTVKSAGQLHPVPILANRPSTGLRIEGDEEHSAGSAVELELPLGPGRHELTVHSDSFPLLVQPQVRQPALGVPCLPPLRPWTLERAVAQPLRASSRTDPEVRVHLLAHGKARSLPLRTLCGDEHDKVDLTLSDDRLLAARIALRTGQPLEHGQDELLQWARQCPRQDAKEGLLALARLNQLDAEQVARLQADEGLGPIVQQAAQWFVDDQQAVLATDWRHDGPAARRRIEALLWLAHLHPESKDRWVAQAGEVQQQAAHVTGVTQGFQFLARDTRWTAIRDVNQSAGLHAVQLDSWQPETPSLRVRRALLESLRPEDHLLFGFDELVLAFENHKTAAVDVDLQCRALPFLPALPLTVLWQVDDADTKRVRLEPDGERAALQVTLAPGQHALRLWIEQPLANQYVRLQVHETVEGKTHTLGTEVSDQRQRMFHVSTHDEPLHVTVTGPALLRVDEDRADGLHTRLVYSDAGRRKLELAPEKGEREALLRVFQLEPTVRPEPRSETVWLPPATEEVASPLVESSRLEEAVESQSLSESSYVWNRLAPLALLGPDAPILAVDQLDPFRLGGHEDGSLAFQMGLFQRRPLNEGPAGAASQEFMEYRVTHRYFDEWSNGYLKSDAFLRTLDGSGPTLGLAHQRRLALPQYQMHADLDAVGLVQWPGGALAPTTGGTEFAFQFRGGLMQRRAWSKWSYHLLSARLFARVMSLDTAQYEAGNVDQDIFTAYKSDHRAGMVIADTLVHHPWLDTRWWVRPSLVTNDNFNLAQPDHVSLRTGWTQAAGNWELEASYRISQFFSDNDRSQGLTQQVMYVDAVADEWRLWGRHRSELAVRIAHDLGGGGTSANLTAAVYLDNGRYHRDDYPGERAFSALRHQRAIENRPEP